jgi:hypothetical protein
MMDRREALLLVDRLKRRTRDPDVLTLCEYVHGTNEGQAVNQLDRQHSRMKRRWRVVLLRHKLGSLDDVAQFRPARREPFRGRDASGGHGAST